MDTQGKTCLRAVITALWDCPPSRSPMASVVEEEEREKEMEEGYSLAIQASVTMKGNLHVGASTVA